MDELQNKHDFWLAETFREQTEAICKTIMDGFIDKILFSAKDLVTIFDDVYSTVCQPKKHDCGRVGKNTVTEWKSKYAWLVMNVT